MAKILKCPRCQEKIDVSDLSGGSTVKCDACGTMVRLASGGTQKLPPAAPPPPSVMFPGASRPKNEIETQLLARSLVGGGTAQLASWWRIYSGPRLKETS